MTTPVSFLNQLLKCVLPHAATDPRLAGLLLVAKGQQRAAQALLCHPTLRLQRYDLAQYRVGQEKLADMDLIKSGRLEIGNSSQGEIPKSKWVSNTNLKTPCLFKSGLRRFQLHKPCQTRPKMACKHYRSVQLSAACFGTTLQQTDIHKP